MWYSVQGNETANEILLNIIERRDPGKILKTDDSSCGLELQESRSLNSAKRLRTDFNPILTKSAETDPYLDFLLENMHSIGPTSLSSGQNHRSAIHAGDVVVYEESNGPGIKVMAGVMGFKVACSNSGSTASSARLQDVDFLKSNSGSTASSARLQDVDFESQVQVLGLTDGEDFSLLQCWPRRQLFQV